MTDEERKAILERATLGETVKGARVESVQDFNVVLVYGKPVNHVVHILLAVVTCCIWLFVWPVVGVAGGERKATLIVDDYGNVTKIKIPWRR